MRASLRRYTTLFCRNCSGGGCEGTIAHAIHILRFHENVSTILTILGRLWRRKERLAVTPRALERSFNWESFPHTVACIA